MDWLRIKNEIVVFTFYKVNCKYSTSARYFSPLSEHNNNETLDEMEEGSRDWNYKIFTKIVLEDFICANFSVDIEEGIKRWS